MEPLAFIKFFPTGLLLGATSPIESLPFNPIKLIILVVWVYLCLYFVQRTQYSPLVPKRYKALANIAALLTGPVLLFVLLVKDIIRMARLGQKNIYAVIKEQLQNLGSNIKLTTSHSTENDSAIMLLDSSGRDINEIYGHGKRRRRDRHILEFTEQIITDALEERASDILIDPRDESTYTIRFRVDGVLMEVDQIDVGNCQAVINSIKAVSGMDIAERRRPQDGAFIAKIHGATSSFRVASAGAVNGEKLSVRVLNPQTGLFTLSDTGMSEEQKEVVEEAISKPSGMLLLCGPTGSGKTTTLYAMLNNIDLFTRNVITVEDPIEYVLPNTSQIEVNPKAGITFAKTLRSILRQDPDVIIVGEIRDEETAEIALRASQTGHLVIATIHSSSNTSAMIRLLDLGITPLLLSSGLNLVISQRLVRRLCSECRIPAELTEKQMQLFHEKGIGHGNIFRAVGCEMCHGTGYSERTAIFDILSIDRTLKSEIANNESLIAQLKKQGDGKGQLNLQTHGLKKAASGITSLEELKRVIG